MALNVSQEGDRVVVRLPKLFGFAVRAEFKQATSGKPVGTRYKLDFQEVERMDSSALGMLLLLRETSGGLSADIQIVNTRPEIRKLLQLANFHTLFTIV
ncbi:MAG: STAS domain-containing protein [Magnetococcales bacterium]|nr:STAS domain-containing protein [Magnetococcales bacterium]NGZ04775.1 STAS domain-containing protein [Magnetococcales bacterium]